jgi:putative aldouronate transport system permease protein
MNAKTKPRGRVSSWLRDFNQYKYLISMILPAIIVLFIFVYMPMGGNVLAFKEYSVRKGIWGSDWVGMKYFARLWRMPAFWNVFRNEIVIGASKLLIGFPAPIFLAIVLNEVRSTKAKRFFQTTYTFPHFLSWIVVAGIIIGFLSDQGFVNQLLVMLGLEKHRILHDGDQFRMMLYLTDLWKEAGWNSILYLAALSGINPELYEAAGIDGANRRQQVWHITWPCLIPLAAILLVLSAGRVLSGGFDQILNLYNTMVYDKADIIDTYLYRTSILQGTDFSYATAVGLFKSVVNIALLLTVNFAVKKMGQEGIV